MNSKIDSIISDLHHKRIINLSHQRRLRYNVISNIDYTINNNDSIYTVYFPDDDEDDPLISRDVIETVLKHFNINHTEYKDNMIHCNYNVRNILSCIRAHYQ